MSVFSRLIALTLFGGLFITTLAQAQDNIILKNGTEIPAKVLEVSPGQIKYRRQDNPDGPIYSTGTTDVLLIRYANGTKDILNGSRLPAGLAAPAATAIPGASPTASSSPALNKVLYHPGLFSRYFTNELGERIDRSFISSAFASDPEAMQAYQRGQSLRRWSYVSAGGAVALLGASALVALTGDETNHRDGINDRTTTNDQTGSERRGDHGSTELGIALAGGGVLLGATALYLGHRATVQFRRAANRYNTHSSTSLRFAPSSRGLGISVALGF